MLITAIAYDVERNLGRAYNETMSRLRADDWCCFIDHDAMFTTRGWYPQILAAIEENPRAGLFAAVTNRIGRKSQVPAAAPPGHDMRDHFAFGRAQFEQYGHVARDITRDSPISGVVMCMPKSAWTAIGGFKEGFFGVDNRAHRDIARAGLRVYLLPGLYVYHWYRADGVGHDGAPRASQ
jgi:GT2 family glycosyltransferase